MRRNEQDAPRCNCEMRRHAKMLDINRARAKIISMYRTGERHRRGQVQHQRLITCSWCASRSLDALA